MTPQVEMLRDWHTVRRNPVVGVTAPLPALRRLHLSCQQTTMTYRSACRWPPDAVLDPLPLVPRPALRSHPSTHARLGLALRCSVRVRGCGVVARTFPSVIRGTCRGSAGARWCGEGLSLTLWLLRRYQRRFTMTTQIYRPVCQLDGGVTPRQQQHLMLVTLEQR